MRFTTEFRPSAHQQGWPDDVAFFDKFDFFDTTAEEHANQQILGDSQADGSSGLHEEESPAHRVRPASPGNGVPSGYDHPSGLPCEDDVHPTTTPTSTGEQ